MIFFNLLYVPNKWIIIVTFCFVLFLSLAKDKKSNLCYIYKKNTHLYFYPKGSQINYEFRDRIYVLIIVLIIYLFYVDKSQDKTER